MNGKVVCYSSRVFLKFDFNRFGLRTLASVHQNQKVKPDRGFLCVTARCKRWPVACQSLLCFFFGVWSAATKFSFLSTCQQKCTTISFDVRKVRYFRCFRAQSDPKIRKLCEKVTESVEIIRKSSAGGGVEKVVPVTSSSPFSFCVVGCRGICNMLNECAYTNMCSQ